MQIGWLTAFLDLPTTVHRAGVDFWCAVTGSRPSPVRGERGQFSTAVPPEGDPVLRFQDIGAGAVRVHLDLHVRDVDVAADRAVGLGALEQPSPYEDVRIQRSPGGFTYCFVDLDELGRRPPSARWVSASGSAYTSELDQVCLDIPTGRHDDEVRFWTALTGWAYQPSPDSTEFSRLRRADGLALQLLLQRLDDDEGEVRAHLDLACSDPAAEIERHVALGARDAYPGRGWHTLVDPTGSPYCITSRTPH